MTNSSTQALSVLTVPAFHDNYLWLIHDGSHAVAVDPGDAKPILAALKANGLKLTAILLTHHHADHIGGVPELLQHYQVPVFGPRNESIAAITLPVGEGKQIDVPGLPLRLSVLDVPGHTMGHIAYVREPSDDEPTWLFCGDTLFAGGCGRLFEGTPAQMISSLGKLAALPDDTKIYCAHEYTLSNLRFARVVDPDNLALQERVKTETDKREHDVPTVPSTVGVEKATNPFLRYRETAIAEQLVSAGKLDRVDTPLATFTALRLWKNDF